MFFDHHTARACSQPLKSVTAAAVGLGIFVLVGAGGCETAEFFCRYMNPYSHLAECKAYVGADWDEALATADCDDIFPGSDGVLGAESCDEAGSIGWCITDGDTDTKAVTYFSQGDAAAAESACTSFARGVWVPNGDAPAAEPLGQLMPEALKAMRSSLDVTVEPMCADRACIERLAKETKFIAFHPRTSTPTTGLVVYPGGLVDPRAYAPLAHAIARQGYLVVIVPMRSYLAINGLHRADDVVQAYPDIDRWVVSGHSLGGAMASQYVWERPGKMAGLIIWSAYPDEDHPLDDRDIPLLMLWGSEENLDEDEEFARSLTRVPPGTTFVRIPGGSHSQFGFYGDPRGEEPFIDHAKQLEIITASSLRFLAGLGKVSPVEHKGFAAARSVEASWCSTAQQIIANVGDALRSDSLESVILRRPAAFKGMDLSADPPSAPVVTVAAFPELLANAIGLDSPPMIDGNISCTVHSQRAVMAGLSAEAAGPEGTCADINRAAYDWALDQLTGAERASAAARGQLVFAADQAWPTRDEWFDNGHVDVVDNQMRAASAQEPGLRMCRVWSPSRMLLWVLGHQDGDDRRYVEARRRDEGLCMIAQHRVAGLSEEAAGIVIGQVLHGKGASFGGNKATIALDLTPQLEVQGRHEGHLLPVLPAPSHLSDALACKLRSRERVIETLGVSASDGSDCRAVNKETFAWAMAQLTPAEQARYDAEGTPLAFGDDLILTAGGRWLPVPLSFESAAAGGYLLHSPAALTPLEQQMTPDDLFGVYYCRLLSHQQAMYWLRRRAFEPEPVPALGEESGCHPLTTPQVVASCIFYFGVAEQHFCAEYWGSEWTAASAAKKCATRDGTFAATMCEDRSEETAGLDGDGEFKGMCVVGCGEESERRWVSYSLSPSGNPEEFCTDWFPAE